MWMSTGSASSGSGAKILEGADLSRSEQLTDVRGLQRGNVLVRFIEIKHRMLIVERVLAGRFGTDRTISAVGNRSQLITR